MTLNQFFGFHRNGRLYNMHVELQFRNVLFACQVCIYPNCMADVENTTMVHVSSCYTLVRLSVFQSMRCARIPLPTSASHRELLGGIVVMVLKRTNSILVQ